jgi:leucine dehydrogenase
MGTTVADLAELATVAFDVSCDDVDPSGWTALGVLAGIESAVEQQEGHGLRGMTVVVQGAGHVGAALSRMLADKGCRVVVTDVDPARAHSVASAVGGEVVDPAAAVSWPCDVLAPCAVGRVITRDSAREVRARFVAGAANDVLDERACAGLLAQRGITYVPDFVLNAGGVVEIHARRAGWDRPRLRDEIVAIGNRVVGVLEASSASGSTPLEIAEGLAWARVGRPVRLLDRASGFDTHVEGSLLGVSADARTPARTDGSSGRAMAIATA